MYEQSSNYCTDTAMGTYVASVPNFVNAYLDQMADNAQGKFCCCLIQGREESLYIYILIVSVGFCWT